MWQQTMTDDLDPWKRSRQGQKNQHLGCHPVLKLLFWSTYTNIYMTKCCTQIEWLVRIIKIICTTNIFHSIFTLPDKNIFSSGSASFQNWHYIIFYKLTRNFNSPVRVLAVLPTKYANTDYKRGYVLLEILITDTRNLENNFSLCWYLVVRSAFIYLVNATRICKTVTKQMVLTLLLNDRLIWKHGFIRWNKTILCLAD